MNEQKKAIACVNECLNMLDKIQAMLEKDLNTDKMDNIFRIQKEDDED